MITIETCVISRIAGALADSRYVHDRCICRVRSAPSRGAAPSVYLAGPCASWRRPSGLFDPLLELSLMELRDCEELLKVLDSCLSRIKWRLRPLARRRLETGPFFPFPLFLICSVSFWLLFFLVLLKIGFLWCCPVWFQQPFIILGSIFFGLLWNIWNWCSFRRWVLAEC